MPAASLTVLSDISFLLDEQLPRRGNRWPRRVASWQAPRPSKPARHRANLLPGSASGCLGVILAKLHLILHDLAQLPNFLSVPAERTFAPGDSAWAQALDTGTDHLAIERTRNTVTPVEQGCALGISKPLWTRWLRCLVRSLNRHAVDRQLFSTRYKMEANGRVVYRLLLQPAAGRAIAKRFSGSIDASPPRIVDLWRAYALNGCLRWTPAGLDPARHWTLLYPVSKDSPYWDAPLRRP